MSSLILQTASRATFHTILLISLFLLFAGHNAPGGGFIGGLVAGAGFVLRYIAEGSDDLRRLVPTRPERLLGAGVLLATGAGLAGLLWGQELLEAALIEADVPALGHVAASTVLVFDAGVYLVVVGLALMVLQTLGAEIRE